MSHSIVVGGESLVDLILDPSGGIQAVPGGGPYNAARTVARLGGHSTFLGRFSDDRFGARLRDSLAADGVRLGCPDPTTAPTTLAVAELDDGGAARYRFYFAGTSAPQLTPDQAVDALPPDLGALHVGTLGLVLEPIAQALEAVVGQVGDEVLVFLDPNCRPGVALDDAVYLARLERVLARADVVKVSADDLDYLEPGVPALDAARHLLRHGPKAVLLTAGGDEVVVLTASAEQALRVPRVTVADTVGAGDSFGGAFLTAWTAAGTDHARLGDLDALRRPVEAAIAVAAITCQRVGADPPHLADLPAEVAAAFAQPTPA